MPTPKFDAIAIEFIKRIPTTFKTSFTAGTLMPDSYALPAVQITDYVNRGMINMFNDYWKITKGNPLIFSKLFPELVRISTTTTFGGGTYTIATPNLDFKAIVGGLIGTTFIKVWDPTKYTIAISGIYPEYVTTTNKPAIIQMNKKLSVFPYVITPQDASVIMHYIALPIDPTTGTALAQNGSSDSPFDANWNTEIADHAYSLFLEETLQTQ